MSTPTFEYFVNRLTEDIRRITEGNGNRYDHYETTSHHVDFHINGHKVNLIYDLRITVATPELELFDRIKVDAHVTLSAYEDANNHVEPSAKKRHGITINTTADTLEEQVNEAVKIFTSAIIGGIDIPPAQFDFWKYVAYAMPQFDKIVGSALRDNSDNIERTK
jgi:hypothetical protein